MSKCDLKGLYKTMLSNEYGGKEIWEYFNEDLTSTPLTSSIAFKGKKYDDSKTKLIAIGRAMNGWEAPFSSCKSIEDLITKILDQKFSFSDVIRRKEKTQHSYLYIRSKFWKLIKYVLEEFGEANDEWYDDNNDNSNMNWNEKIVWSNLYKVSPRYKGNPDNQLIKKTLKTNIDILKFEIDENKPEKILFVTDEWYLKPFPDMPAFVDEFGIKFDHFDQQESKRCVIGSGTYGKAKIVVCTRPDIWGSTNQYVRNMAKEIKEAFDPIKSDLQSPLLK